MPERTQPITETELSLIKAVTELQINSKLIADAVKRLEDTNEGTVERKGIKERIALAEENISQHKQAWIKNEQHLGEMEVRLTSRIDSKFEALNKTIETQKTFIDKVRPYMNVIMWGVSLLTGWFLIQIASGNLQITRTP